MKVLGLTSLGTTAAVAFGLASAVPARAQSEDTGAPPTVPA